MQPMRYSFTAIPDEKIPRASEPAFQHMLDTYASETNKVVSVWREFGDEDLAFRPHRALDDGRRHPEASAALGATILRRVHRLAGAGAGGVCCHRS